MTSLRLHDMERHSWRMSSRDGLTDILFGFMLLGACVSTFVGLWETLDWVRILSLATIQLGGVGIIALMRKRMVVPRTGHVKFAARRTRRIRFMRILLGVCVGITIMLVVLTALSRRLGFGFMGESSAWTAWGVISAVTMVPISALAFFRDYPRLLLHGSLFVVAEFCLVVLDLEKLTPYAGPLVFGIGSLISFGIGIPIFVHFLRSVPRVTTDRLGGLNE